MSDFDKTYRIGERLARGSIGELLEAHQANLDRDVLVRRVSPEFRSNEAVWGRLQAGIEL